MFLETTYEKISTGFSTLIQFQVLKGTTGKENHKINLINAVFCSVCVMVCMNRTEYPLIINSTILANFVNDLYVFK